MPERKESEFGAGLVESHHADRRWLWVVGGLVIAGAVRFALRVMDIW